MLTRTASLHSMSTTGSVTAWIDELCAGNRAAAEPLWRDYSQRLVTLARQTLRGRLRGAMVGAEDVAIIAFDSFYRAAAQGRFPQLNDRDDVDGTPRLNSLVTTLTPPWPGWEG